MAGSDKVLESIVNKQPFSYDASADPVYQAYAKEYQALGEKSKADTLRDVSTLNGSSTVADYAQIAAQQAQNTYRQQMSTVIPALEEAAYSRWKGKSQMEQSNYSLLRDDEDTKYGRQRDRVSDNQYKYQADRNRYEWNKTFNYGKKRDKVGDKQWGKQFSWQKTMDNREYELKKKQLAKQRSSYSGNVGNYYRGGSGGSGSSGSSGSSNSRSYVKKITKQSQKQNEHKPGVAEMMQQFIYDLTKLRKK